MGDEKISDVKVPHGVRSALGTTSSTVSEYAHLNKYLGTNGAVMNCADYSTY